VGRFYFHPVLTHPRSRFIFFLFLILSASLGALCWLRLSDALQQAGVTSADISAGHPFLVFLLTPTFRIVLVALSAWLAAGFTAHRVVGPIERLENWLERAQDEKNPAGFRLRKGDKYYKLVLLINRLLKHA